MLLLKKLKIKAKTKVLIEFYLVRAFIYLIIFGSIFVHAYLIGKVQQGITILIAYSLLRWTFPTTWHHKKTLNCAVYSVTIFITLDSLSLPFEVSILSSVVLALALTYGLYKLQVLIDNQIIVRNFCTDNCTEQELIDRCKEIHLSEENTKLAVEFFIKKTKQSEIASRLCVEEHAVSTRKLRLKQKLNKK
jgi:hypothetical protein